MPPVVSQSLSPQSFAERFASTLSAHDMDGFASLFSDSYINHQVSAASAVSPGNIMPKQASLAIFKSRLDGLADLNVVIEAMVADESHVAASFVYSGTHTGTFLGAAPTGRTIRFTSCDIFRVKTDCWRSHWGMGDTAGLLAQLRGT